jgi:hypothetical protein
MAGGGGGGSKVPAYPNMFSPDQMINKFSDWNDAKYQMATLPSRDEKGDYYVTDALGNRITPPSGVTLTGPNNWARYDPSTGQTTSGTENYYPYIQALANPNRVVTPGPAFDPNRPAPAPNNFAQILQAFQPGANVPGYTPATATPGVSLGGGSSNISYGAAPPSFLQALSAIKGAK